MANLYKSTPEQVQDFKENLDAGMEQLVNLFEFVESDPGFAKSLISYHSIHDALTDKQAYRACGFLHEAAENAGESIRYHSSGTQGTTVKRASQPEQNTVDIPRVPVSIEAGAALIAMFDLAIEKIKYPSVTIPLDESCHDFNCLHFNRTGRMSKMPIGCINITNGKSGEDWKIVAQILRDGTLIWGGYVFGKPELQQVVKRIVENFTTEAVVQGKKMVACCFCRISLTSSISVYHGYGPICAGNWGLPWEGSDEVKEAQEEIIKLGDL